MHKKISILTVVQWFSKQNTHYILSNAFEQTKTFNIMPIILSYVKAACCSLMAQPFAIGALVFFLYLEGSNIPLTRFTFLRLSLGSKSGGRTCILRYSSATLYSNSSDAAQIGSKYFEYICEE